MMLFNALQWLTLVIACCLSSFGLWLLIRKPLRSLGEQIAVENRVRRKNRERKEANLEDEQQPSLMERIVKDIDYMLQNTKKSYKPSTTVQSFIIFHLCALLLIGFIVHQWTGSVLFSAFIAIAFVSINFIRHRIMLRTVRLQAGYDLAEITGVLSSKYNSSLVPQMRKALGEANAEIRHPLFKKHFMNIVRVDQNYKKDHHLQDAVDRMVYSVNTSFAKEFGVTIYRALVTKENVGDSLVRIDRKIQKNMQDIKEEAELRYDIRLLGWFHVIAFPATFIGVSVLANVTQSSMFYYQFQTPAGQFRFALSVIVIMASMLVSVWFNKQPNDY